jgi:hypothetical protein
MNPLKIKEYQHDIQLTHKINIDKTEWMKELNSLFYSLGVIMIGWLFSSIIMGIIASNAWIASTIVALVGNIGRAIIIALKKEKIFLLNNLLMTETSFFRKGFIQDSYILTNITHARIAERKNQTKGKVCFTYEGKTVHIGRHLNLVEAEEIVKILTDIRTFHCHEIEVISFGTPSPQHEASATSLLNPDVLSLMTPFYHLKRINIYVETYDFYLVERFLTYAVNYIGQTYLRQTVEINIYGNVEQLHSNLYHNFKNLCKEVYLHKNDHTEEIA